MITTDKTVLPDVLRKELRQRDIEEENRNDDNKNAAVDSECDVNSESSLSSKSENDDENTETTSKMLKSGKWSPCNIPAEEDSTRKRGNFSIKSLLSSGQSQSSHTAEPCSGRDLWGNSSSETIRCDEIKKNNSYLTRASDPPSCSYPNPERNKNVDNSSCPQPGAGQVYHMMRPITNKPSLPPTSSSFEKSDKFPHLGYPDMTSENFLPPATIPAFNPIHPTHLHPAGSQVSMPSLMQRFGTIPYGMTPFRPHFSPAFPLHWLQNEAILRNLSDLAGEYSCCFVFWARMHQLNFCLTFTTI